MPMRAQKIVVGMVAGHGEDEIVLQLDRALGSLEIDVVSSDFLHRAVEVGRDLAAS